jgi:glycosyltransferase involved in cell wall biosynthesis
MSTDGTYEAIRNIDPKIKIFRSNWDDHAGLDWVNHFKDEARRRCTGDWCILLDADEFIPEWKFEKLRTTLAQTDAITLSTNLLNFYGNFRVYHSAPEKFRLPAVKRNIHRNRPDITMHGGDASSVTYPGETFTMDPSESVCTLHHFGAVRKPARLRELWRNMRGRLYNAPPPRVQLPSWLFGWFPHDWRDPDFLPYLAIYPGPYCAAVRNDEAEFTRDGMQLYDYLLKHGHMPDGSRASATL